MTNRGHIACMLVALLILPVAVHAETQDGVNLEILVDWDYGWWSSEIENNYVLQFADDREYEFTTIVSLERGGTQSVSEILVTQTSVNPSTYTLEVNESLTWGDEYEISVTVSSVDQVPLTSNLLFERVIKVGTWGQAIDDHEVTTTNSWSLEQYQDVNSSLPAFDLQFAGNGWQQRIGSNLESWELGDGILTTMGNSSGQDMNLNLVFDRIWNNQTSEYGIVTSQIIEAKGFGVLDINSTIDGTNFDLDGNVSQAWYNRTMIDGIVDEKTILEANGDIYIDESTNESTTIVEGEISTIYIETHDYNGTRVYDHQQLEGAVDFVYIEDGTRLDLEVGEFIQTAIWENGIRIDHVEKIDGSGTFGFVDSDENASMMVNGTVYSFVQWIEDGVYIGDSILVDGTLSGDVQGTFGVVRDIEETTTQANYTGVTFPVNIVHQEEWFNITGINGGNFFDGAGAGAYHNESWSYDVIYSDWTNRTVRIIWSETGPDASSGDERPERSPIQVNATAPEPENTFQSWVSIRESGLAPIPAMTGDEVYLKTEDQEFDTIRFGNITNEVKDGHNFQVIEWEMMMDNMAGAVSGTIIQEGPLAGLFASESRSFQDQIADDWVWFNETKTLEHVVSPSVVTAEENTAPSLTSAEVRGGYLGGEGENTGVLEVTISDPDWNVESVTADLSGFGMGIVALNDRGLEGDDQIADGVYSHPIRVDGIQFGSLIASITIIDAFDEEVTENVAIEVSNPGPRLVSTDIVPNQASRSDLILLDLVVVDQHEVSRVALDLRQYGGDIIEFTQDGIWSGSFIVPDAMTPGDRVLTFILEDSEGARRITSNTLESGASSSSALVGPWVFSSDDVSINIMNDGPEINGLITNKFDKQNTPKTEVIEVNVTDPDGVSSVIISLGVYRPITVNDEWIQMRNDGQGGDRIAGDNIWSAEISIRDGTPLGIHEIEVRASDTYGKQSSTESYPVSLEQGTSTIIGGEGESNILMYVGIGVLFILGAAFLVIGGRKDENDIAKTNQVKELQELQTSIENQRNR